MADISQNYIDQIRKRERERAEQTLKSKLSEIVIDVTIWLNLEKERSRLDMDEGVNHIRELLNIFKEQDDECKLVN